MLVSAIAEELTSDVSMLSFVGRGVSSSKPWLAIHRLSQSILMLIWKEAVASFAERQPGNKQLQKGSTVAEP